MGLLAGPLEVKVLSETKTREGYDKLENELVARARRVHEHELNQSHLLLLLLSLRLQAPQLPEPVTGTKMIGRNEKIRPVSMLSSVTTVLSGADCLRQ